MNPMMNPEPRTPILLLIGATLVVGSLADGRQVGPAAPRNGSNESRTERVREVVVPGFGVHGGRPVRETRRIFSFDEVLSVQEHRIWLAVREGALEEEEAESLRAGLGAVLEGRWIPDPLDPHPDRMWKDLLGDEDLGRLLGSLPALGKMEDALEHREEARRRRFTAASAELALARIDDLLLVPEADRRAWIRGLAHWVSVEGFIKLLEYDRITFLFRLPSLSLPSVDPDLIRTRTQGVLWEIILTGRMEDDASGGADPHAGTDRAEGRIEMEEFVRMNDPIRNAEPGFGRRESDEENWKTLRDMALVLLERYGECLGVPDEEASRHLFAGTRGALGRWERKEKRSRIDIDGRPWGVGIWDVNAESLVGQPFYQKLLRDVLSLDAYAGWRQRFNRRKSTGIRALRDFAVARMDLRLQLSPSQRERAQAVSLAFEEGDPPVDLQEGFPPREVVRVMQQFDLDEEPLLVLIYRQIALDLDSDSMTSWQRQEVEALLKELEEW